MSQNDHQSLGGPSDNEVSSSLLMTATTEHKANSDTAPEELCAGLQGMQLGAEECDESVESKSSSLMKGGKGAVEEKKATVGHNDETTTDFNGDPTLTAKTSDTNDDPNGAKATSDGRNDKASQPTTAVTTSVPCPLAPSIQQAAVFESFASAIAKTTVKQYPTSEKTTQSIDMPKFAGTSNWIAPKVVEAGGDSTTENSKKKKRFPRPPRSK